MATVLTSISVWLLDKLAGKGFDYLATKLKEGAELDSKFKLAIVKVSHQLQKKYPSILGNEIEFFFLEKDTFFELFKLLFRISKPNIETIQSKFDVTTLPSGFIIEFVEELKQELLKDRDFDTLLSNNEIYFTISGIRDTIETVKNNTTLTSSEIQSIKKILEERFETNFSKNDFQRIYFANVLNILSQVNFIGLGLKSHIRKNRKKLQDIYVKPRFAVVDPKFRKTLDNNLFVKNNRRDYYDDVEETLLFNNLFSLNKNLVILGNPGSGKSFLVKKIICSLLEDNIDDFEIKPIFNYIPFRVELRKYLQFKKQRNSGIVKYILFSLESEYGIINTPEKPFINLLKEENIFVFFDGLDEIFNATDKIDIKNDIESFINNHKNSKIIVTSRTIGYDEARLSETHFCELKILDFNKNQISEYVSKWYEQEEIDEEIRNKEIAEFSAKQNKIDRELIKNPLLLSLIVILFRNNLKIPDSKLEIYQSCTKTLVEKWDSIKDLKIDLNEQLNKKKESLFADLAFWQYKKLSSKKITITNNQAIETITDSIIKKHKLTDDWIEGEKLAHEFFNYALKRSLYFDNNFTHKTFLEYFAAYWIYSNIEKKHKPEERDKILSKYINNSFWFIVLELLLNMIDQDQPDTEIMETIYETLRKSKTDSLPFLITILPTIKNVSPSYKVFFLKNVLLFMIGDAFPKKLNSLTKVFDSLEDLCNNDDNLKYFIEAATKVHTDLKDDDGKLRLFYSLIVELGTMSGSANFKNFKVSFFQKDSFIRISTKDSHLLTMSIYENDAKESDFFKPFKRFVELLGIKSLFKIDKSVYAGFHFGPFFNYFLMSQFTDENIMTIKDNYHALEDLGLTKKQFLVELINNAHFGSYRNLALQNVINLYCKEEDLFYKGIYLTLIRLKAEYKNVSSLTSAEKCIGFNHVLTICEIKGSPAISQYILDNFVEPLSVSSVQ